jgi:antitoxin component HigA of HigAB toxin-antitoxin module
VLTTLIAVYEAVSACYPDPTEVIKLRMESRSQTRKDLEAFDCGTSRTA